MDLDRQIAEEAALGTYLDRQIAEQEALYRKWGVRDEAGLWEKARAMIDDYGKQGPGEPGKAAPGKAVAGKAGAPQEGRLKRQRRRVSPVRRRLRQPSA